MTMQVRLSGSNTTGRWVCHRYYYDAAVAVARAEVAAGRPEATVKIPTGGKAFCGNGGTLIMEAAELVAYADGHGDTLVAA